MTGMLQYYEEVGLYVEGRISPADAHRQERTAREILSRLENQPGLILADEVGMGKTFVALAVAVSVALHDPEQRQVVIMVPPSLKHKWPTDFQVFRERCLSGEAARLVSCGIADNGVDFLKLLDDPPERKKQLIFATHGALSRGLSDSWVKLALIRQAVLGRRGADRMRRALARIMGKLLFLKWAERMAVHGGKELWLRLLTAPPSEWLGILHRLEVDPENDDDPSTDDDPVPRAIMDVLPDLDMGGLYEALKAIPFRQSKHFELRLKAARQAINKEMRNLWEVCLHNLDLRLPLLILDEAHHLKNPSTKLASLFQVKEAQDDAEELTTGPLGGVFERMVFLTATPFQLGHSELCSVLERFQGIAWDSSRSPRMNRPSFRGSVAELRLSLDAAQDSALALDAAWSRLRQEDLGAEGTASDQVEEWWENLKQGVELTPAGRQVRRSYCRTLKAMNRAQELLRPWVIRHLRSRQLPDPYQHVTRRKRFCGQAICTDRNALSRDQGISVEGEALLPFLLAARAAYRHPDSRPVFAEGLASSYEAFLSTRRNDQVSEPQAEDEDEDILTLAESWRAVSWHLDQLEKMVPAHDTRKSASHPKITATTERVVQAWSEGEKVVVFCHWIVTGKVLRRCISEALQEAILEIGYKKLGCRKSEVNDRLALVGERFEKDSPLRLACDAQVEELLNDYVLLGEHKDKLQGVVRRFVRTPSFLVRFFPLRRNRFSEADMEEALDRPDRSGLTLRQMLRDFFSFLQDRCVQDERRGYLEALSGFRTGVSYTRDQADSFSDDELGGDSPERLLPNVRLVNGATKAETRRRLMLTFNTPFYPEVLIASSVLSEGVDLHLNCRYVIHHDLCWNPSTLEQRTGRVDRIGAKVERCGRPVRVYLPYVAATQDEKMYRVVMDRERWFNVVMGEQFKVDVLNADRIAERIPLPDALARELMFDLGVD